MRDDDSSQRDDEMPELPDLTVWEAPPPPAGLADAVLARLAAGEGDGAGGDGGDVAPRATAVEPAASHGRWRVGLAALAVGGLAAAAVIALRLGRGESTTTEHGVVAAANPSHLEIGGASADLDAGARVRWTRDAGGVTVWQRGVARWTVRDGSTLRIHPGDAPGVAASSADASHGASIEASGASLRVEVPMTFSDARVIGASALTAAAVALATVVVYDGHVKATSGGQSVVVMPGATVALRENAPPAPPAPAPPAPEPPLVGAAAPHVVDRTVAPRAGSDETDDRREVHVLAKSPVYGDRDPHAEVQFVAQPDDTLYASVVLGTWTFVENDEGDGGWVQTSALGEHAPSSCDPDRLTVLAKQDYSVGDYVGAMSACSESLACHYDPSVNKLGFIAACAARDVPRARTFYARLDIAGKHQLLQSCLTNGISEDDLSGGASAMDRAPAAAPTAKAHLAIRCKPAARILIDGKDTKLTTPISDYAIEPGQHKVTFMIDEDRFTYGIVLKPGERTTLSKDLQ